MRPWPTPVQPARVDLIDEGRAGPLLVMRVWEGAARSELPKGWSSGGSAFLMAMSTRTQRDLVFFLMPTQEPVPDGNGEAADIDTVADDMGIPVQVVSPPPDR